MSTVGSIPELAGAPLIDISVVTHQSAHWIESFMRSLLAQSYDCARIRLLVRDNGSVDETPKAWQRWHEQASHRFAAFDLQCGDNVGFGCGHNANLSRATTDWMLVTNVDLEFEFDTLALLLERAMASEPRVASWECRQKPYEHPKHYHPVTGETLWSSSACVLFRVAALREIGGYEPRLFLYGEDVEISYRLRDHGWRLLYVPRAIVWHHTYEHARQVKPAQFLGSTLANVLLRMRYGTAFQALQGVAMFLALFALPARFAGQRRHLLRQAFRLAWLAPYFLLSRRRSTQLFPFRLWDYEFARHGAFHQARLAQSHHREQPLVSVIVRTMAGRRGRLLEAVASIAQQTYRRVELVLVEDGSDSAAELAELWRHSGEFASVRYLALPKGGRCRAGNAGLSLASGELICFLDDDDLFYADHLETLLDALRDRPDLGAAYALAFEVRTAVHSTEPWVYSEIDHSLIHRQPFRRAVLWYHNFMPIQTVLFRRELYERYGGFDLELDQLEDWNLWVRYSLHHDFMMVDKVTSLYRVPALATEAAGRQQLLDHYYAKAVAKHSELRLELNPNEVLALARGLADEQPSVARPMSMATAAAPASATLTRADSAVVWARRAVLATPGLRLLYYPLRASYHALWRLRGKR